MDDRQNADDRHQQGPDPLPFTSGNEFAPFQRQHDSQAAPQRTGVIVVTTLGVLLLVALVIWLLS